MTDFTPVKCCQCSEPFGLATVTYETLRRSGGTFRCPWGHQQHFTAGPSAADKAKAEADKLRLERDRLQQRLAQKDDEIRAQSEWRQAAQRQASAMKGVATRLKNRAAAGVCPCCNRTFRQLAHHMASKHKGFAATPLAGAETMGGVQ